jgi:hypothetical protein
VAQSGGNVARSVAGDAGLGDSKDFRRLDHDALGLAAAAWHRKKGMVGDDGLEPPTFSV